MLDSSVPIITIDGPGGSGKGTIGLLVANKLKWHFLDSGALYRVLAYHVQQQRIDLDNEVILERFALELPVKFTSIDPTNPEKVDNSQQIYLQERIVTDVIREEIYGRIASKIAVLPKVRTALLDKQRAFLLPPGLVADGRDMGSVVFPEARLKIFLQASIEDRAKRRYLQLKEKGLSGNLQDLVREIAARDEQDRERKAAPMRPASDAVVIDTTSMSIEVVFDRVMDEVASVGGLLS